MSLPASCNQVKIWHLLFIGHIFFYSLLSISCLLSLMPGSLWCCLWFRVTPGYSHCLQLLEPWFLTDMPSLCLDTSHTYLNRTHSFFRFSLAALLVRRLAPRPRATEDSPTKLTLPVQCLTRHPSLQLSATSFPHGYALFLPLQNPCGPRHLLPVVLSPAHPAPPPAPASAASSCMLSTDALSCAFLFARKTLLNLSC